MLSFTTSVGAHTLCLALTLQVCHHPRSEADVNAEVGQETTVSTLSQNGDKIRFYCWLFCIQIYVLGARF